MNPTQIESVIFSEVTERHFEIADSAVGTVVGSVTSQSVTQLVRQQITSEARQPPRAIGTAAHRANLTTSQSSARRITIRAFCDNDTHRRSPLKKSDFARCFPTLYQAGFPGGYYVDATGPQPILGHVRVDVGLDDIGRIVQRCHKLAWRHQQLIGFRQLIAAGQFEISYLVATDEKARRLSVAFRSIHKTGVRCVAFPMPILLDLLAPLPAT